MSELRLDPLSGEWVTIAAKRLTRPVTTSAQGCPFCPVAPAADRALSAAADQDVSEAPNPDYGVAVFSNRFPSFGGDDREPPAAQDGYRNAPGRGRAEIVLYSPSHDVHLATMPTTQVRLLVDVWADRTEALYADAAAGVQYVFPFENRGRDVGQTIDHPHGQIYGYPFLPPRVAAEYERLRAHREDEGECLQCEILRRESADPRRQVAQTPGWLQFVPYAPRFPFETHLVPLRHAGRLAELTSPERDALALLLQDAVSRYDGLHAVPMPYMMWIFQSPRNDLPPAGTSSPAACGAAEPHSSPPAGYWHLRISFHPLHRAAGRLKYLAGSESGAGAFLQDAAPETMAQALRSVVR